MNPVFFLTPANVDDASGAPLVRGSDVKALGCFVDAIGHAGQPIQPDQTVTVCSALHRLQADLCQFVRGCCEATVRQLREGADQLRRDVIDEHLEIKVAAFRLGGSGLRNLGLRILRVRRQERKKSTCNDDRDPTAL